MKGNMQENLGRIFTKTKANFEHDIYLTGELGAPEEYLDEFQLIRTMEADDITFLHINGPGGRMSTALQFMRCMADTKGTVIASIEGDCLSAYTLMFLSADGWEISDGSIFMIHSYSEGMFGKGGELAAKLKHDTAWFEQIAKETYLPFLNPEELESMLGGKDYYFTPDEVLDRCKLLAEERNKLEIENLPEGTIVVDQDLSVTQEVYEKVLRHSGLNEPTEEGKRTDEWTLVTDELPELRECGGSSCVLVTPGSGAAQYPMKAWYSSDRGFWLVNGDRAEVIGWKYFPEHPKL